MKFIAITLVPSVPLSESITATALKSTLADVSARVAGIPLVKSAVLCTDISYNEFDQIADGDWIGSMEGWQPHVHGIVCLDRREDAKWLKIALKKVFPYTQEICVPVHGRFYDGTTAWPSYILKYEFKRRVAYYDDVTLLRSTAEYPLTAEQDIMVMRAMSELGHAGRIHLIGLNATKDESTNHIRLNAAIPAVG